MLELHRGVLMASHIVRRSTPLVFGLVCVPLTLHMESVDHIMFGAVVGALCASVFLF
ncbi:MAG: hypothetical protein O3C40_13220 [Planctomycetota bacterium]|nr:hypothetical protein [Planctomycetota bacterium]